MDKLIIIKDGNEHIFPIEFVKVNKDNIVFNVENDIFFGLEDKDKALVEWVRSYSEAVTGVHSGKYKYFVRIETDNFVLKTNNEVGILSVFVNKVIEIELEFK